MYETVNDNVEPDLKLSGLSLWVLARQFPESDDFWDGNWLYVNARVEGVGAFVEVSGPILHLSELVHFAEGLDQLDKTLKGSAELRCMEPNLGIIIDCGARGQVSLKVDITPDHMTQSHNFKFEADQTYLSPALRACRRLLERFPIKGASPADHI